MWSPEGGGRKNIFKATGEVSKKKKLSLKKIRVDFVCLNYGEVGPEKKPGGPRFLIDSEGLWGGWDKEKLRHFGFGGKKKVFFKG